MVTSGIHGDCPMIYETFCQDGGVKLAPRVTRREESAQRTARVLPSNTRAHAARCIGGRGSSALLTETENFLLALHAYFLLLLP